MESKLGSLGDRLCDECGGTATHAGVPSEREEIRTFTFLLRNGVILEKLRWNNLLISSKWEKECKYNASYYP